MGTGGAIRHVAPYLESGPSDPVLIFNGDVLTGVDIAGLVDSWRSAGAAVTLYLTPVVYIYLERFDGWVRRLFKKRAVAEVESADVRAYGHTPIHPEDSEPAIRR